MTQGIVLLAPPIGGGDQAIRAQSTRRAGWYGSFHRLSFSGPEAVTHLRVNFLRSKTGAPQARAPCAFEGVMRHAAIGIVGVIDKKSGETENEVFCCGPDLKELKR
jgi:hypothetical protein